jgi:hypothetical protein
MLVVAAFEINVTSFRSVGINHPLICSPTEPIFWFFTRPISSDKSLSNDCQILPLPDILGVARSYI